MIILKILTGRKNMTTSIENELQKEIKKLAIDLEHPFNDLIEEAFRDILKKYKNKSKQKHHMEGSML